MSFDLPVDLSRPPRPSNSDGPGLDYFFSAHYQNHNRSRLNHLRSLGLPLSATSVLELGSGPGDHTGFYVDHGCRVVSVDARQACLDRLADRYPEVKTFRCDLNHPEPLLSLGRFDTVHCYGILYHLDHPEPLLRCIGAVCDGIAVIETCVSRARNCSVEFVKEVLGDFTQSCTGSACRPTRSWVFETLRREFPFVYLTRTQPDHAEFPTDRNDLESAPPLIRSVFVAAKRPLLLPALAPELLDRQQRFTGEV